MIASSEPHISLVIPAFNEERYLDRLLDSVDRARRSYHGGPGAIEVIVADNASTDGTAALAERRGCRVVPVDKRVIAAARNGGAKRARGKILAFVDADSVIHPDTFNAIRRSLECGTFIAGSTGGTLERWSLGLLATYAAFLPFVWLTRFDIGVVFCHRDDFVSIGGYDEGRTFAEDVVFLHVLRRLGRKRGQRLVRATSVKVVASTRKFDEHGDWHYFRMVARHGISGLLGGAGARKFAERYWYHPTR